VTADYPDFPCAHTSEGLVDAAAVAAYLGVERSYVYEHADELGARRLGSGPRARLRFSLEEVVQRLASCSTGRRSETQDSPAPGRVRARRRSERLGSGVELLPIRGRNPLWEAS
jgi:hypothetical protein